MHTPEILSQNSALLIAHDKASVEKKITAIRELNKREIYDIDLTGIVLRGGNLRGLILRYSRLDKADLTGADCKETDFEGSWIINAQLSEADLSNSNQRAVSFESSDLSDA